MKYLIQKIGGESYEYRASSYMEVHDFLSQIRNHANANEFNYFLNKKSVTFDEIFNEVNAFWDAKTQKFQESRKQIWIRTGGVTNARSNFRQIWVKK
jgi:hypothetical protein